MSRVEHKTHIARQDIEIWDGVDRDFTRLTSTGSSITVQKFGNEVDVLLAWGNGTDYTDSAISAAEDAITAENNNAWLVLAPGTWTISSDLTITQGLRVMYGAVLSVASGKTLTINGPFDAGLYQVFSGSGTVTFGATRVKEVYPQWWGVAADGSTDDTTPLQNAINSGRPVCIPGTSSYYKITAALTLANNNYIFGDGILSQIRQATAATDIFVASSKSNITIKDLYLYGTTGAMRGIEFTTVTDSRIENCTIYSCGNAADGSGIWLNTNSHDNQIIGNKLDTCYYGIFVGGGSKHNRITDNEVDSSVTAGIWLKTATHNTVKGNVVHDCTLPGIYLSIGANYNTIGENTSYSNGDSGLYIWDGDSTDCIGNTVKGNTFYDNSPAEIFLRTVTNNAITGNTCMSSQGDGIYLTDAASQNVVQANIVKSATSDGIKLYYSGAEICRENLITGNEVLSSGGYGISLYAAYESQVKDNMVSNNADYGILVTTGAVDVAVSHNTLKANDGGIYFNNADNCSIINNLIVSLSDGSSEYGIQVTANSANPLIHGNRIRLSSNQINNLSTNNAIVHGWLANCD